MRVDAFYARYRVALDGELALCDLIAYLPFGKACAPCGFLQADDAGQLAELLGRRGVGCGKARNS